MAIDVQQLMAKISGLNPDQLAVFEKLLAAQGIDLRQLLILPRLEPADRAPLSYAQQRLWFLDQLEPDSPAYNIPLAVRLTGRLNLPGFQWAMDKIVQRHEILRTTFDSQDGQPVQIIHPQQEIPITFIDLSHLSEPFGQQTLTEQIQQQARLPFNLENGPLLRVSLFRLGEIEYAAVLVMHHIIADGWSMGVLLRELAALYAARIADRQDELQKLNIQYADYAVWQRKWLAGDIREKQLQYWRENLGQSDDNSRVLDLPTDFSRPVFSSGNGGWVHFKLPAGMLQQVRQLAHETGATTFMVLLAAFEVLLSRYSRQNRFHVGTPIANRQRIEIEPLIGFFVNTLVLKADLNGDPNFLQLVARVQQTSLGAFENQDLPFELLAEVLNPERNLSRTPLFQVMFALQNNPRVGYDLPDLRMEMIPSHSGTSTFDLTMILSEQEDGLDGLLEYSTDLFREETIVRLAAHFEVLLASALADPQQPVMSLEILPEIEKRLLLDEWNKTRVNFAGADTPIHHRFEAQAALTPDHLAVIQPESELGPRRVVTYRELDQMANGIAQALSAYGMGPGCFVGICLERSIELIGRLLGILKSGAAYLPLDPAYPVERLEYMLTDSSAQVILTTHALAERLPMEGRKGVFLDETLSPLELPPAVEVSSDSLAYLMYTSGSTGKPKGVLLRHGTVVNHNLAVTGLYEIDEHSRVLQFSTINFDSAVEEIFPALCAGATLVLRPGSILLSGSELTRLVAAEQISHLIFPTAYWHEWVLALQASADRVPACVRMVSVGGERALPERLSAWHMLGGNLSTWFNTYGPTEASIIVTWYKVPPQDGVWDPAQEIPIGKPIANARLYVLDDHLQPVPVGIPGELLIGGPVLALGYHRLPDVTAERFIPDPFVSDRNSRMYRTGDLVRWRPDGELEFIGRTDHQVKIRGFRVELSEIEMTLRRHPAVQDVVVDARLDAAHVLGLAAYVVSVTSQSVSAVELRAFLKQYLPDYMIPAAYVFMDALPVTPGGKIDRKSLPEPEISLLEQDQQVTTHPRSPLEEILAGIWADLLHHPRVGIHDSFFDLGGHSLLATQLVSRIRSITGVDVPVRAVFEQPTIAGLAVWLTEEQRHGRGLQLPPITPVSREAMLPLSFAQQRLWFIDQLDPGSPVYNIIERLEVEGDLDLNLLRQCFEHIASRHEVLRTTFEMKEGLAVQVIHAQMAPLLNVVDLTASMGEDQEIELKRLTAAEAGRGFDLAAGPLIRVTVVRKAPGRYVLLLVMHHIITDGWSTAVMIREFSEIYRALQASQPVNLPDLCVQYADYAVWQRENLTEDYLDTALDYWKQKLADIPPRLDLLTDRPRPAVQQSSGALLQFQIPADLTESLKHLAQARSCSLFMVTLAAFQTLLYRYTSQNVICVGTPIANRNRVEIEGLIGFFINTLVQRADFPPGITFVDLLQQVRQTALDSYIHQDVPFERVVDALKPDRDLSASPLFQVMFLFQNAVSEGFDLPGLRMKAAPVETGLAMYDLTLALEENESGLAVGLEYSTALFDRLTMERMAGHYVNLLSEIVKSPDLSLDKLSFMPQQERQQILEVWNQTDVPRPECCIQDLLTERAAHQPDAVAVIYPGSADWPARELTYQQLDQLSNQLAHTLIDMGVRSGTFVGLNLPRSAELIVGLFGILKAGAAYLPLDPDYPPERLEQMIGESQLKVLVCQHGSRGALHEKVEQVVYLEDGEPWQQASADALPFRVDPQQPAYMIYTSGSTGLPKGVIIRHAALLNHNLATANLYGLGPGEVGLQFSTINFDGAAEEIYPILLSGGKLVMRPDSYLMSGEQLRDLIDTYGISALILPTAYWHALTTQWDSERKGVPQSLRLVVVGGEKAHAERLAVWQNFAGHQVEWINTYGPTEGTIIASAFTLPAGNPWPADRDVPIGRPIANLKLYILNAAGEPVNIGAAGELYIGGVGVAAGYLRRPELNRERFIPNPFASGYLYKTGDRCAYLPDGNILYLGRTDQQVKIHGYRIEPEEIENILQGYPGVRSCAVTPFHDHIHEIHLAAYVAMDPSLFSGAAIRSFLKQHLPEYMLPTVVVRMDAIPMTPAGKVDRRNLPAPEIGEARSKESEIQDLPTSPEERILAELWAEVLGLKVVGIRDNLFELGNDSILSIQLISRAAQAGLGLTARQIFENPTVEGQAAVVQRRKMTVVDQGPVTGDLPLTPIQRWFFDQKFSNPAHWNQAFMVELKRPVRRQDLEKVMAALASHHDQLRARFYNKGGNIQQWIAAPDGKAPLTWADFSALPDDRISQEMEALAAEIQAGLNLEKGPIWRAVYFNLGDHRPARLLVVIHHLVMDAVSWRILLEDFSRGLAQIQADQPVRFAPKTTSFRAWSLRLDSTAQELISQKDIEFWHQQVGRNPGRIALDFPDGTNLELDAAVEIVTISGVDAQFIIRDRKDGRADIQTLLLAALVSTLADWTENKSVVVELEGHGREELFEDVDLSRTVGWFTSVYPLGVDLTDVHSPLQIVQLVQEQLNLIPNHGVGYGVLRWLVGDETLLAETAAPQVSFNYLGQFGTEPGMDRGFTAAREHRGLDRGENNQRTCPIEITAVISSGQLTLEWSYSLRQFHAETIRFRANQMVAELHRICGAYQQAERQPLRAKDFPLANLDQRTMEKVLKRTQFSSGRKQD